MTGRVGDGAVVIVGGGHAGATMAGLLRQAGHPGRIVMYSDEADPPYHRPPLSKKFDGDGLVQWIKPPRFYADNEIELRLDTVIDRVDRSSRVVELRGGPRRRYDDLVLATGATPRALPIPGANARGVRTLRTLSDARALAHAIGSATTLVIVGGGYVGMEVAAVACRANVNVVVVEQQRRILARVASPRLSALLTDYHAARGIRIVTGASVTGIDCADGAVSAVRLDDGSSIPCQVVLVGIGAIPNDRLARQCGLTCADGIVVDRDGRTGDPHVFAIGDVTRRPVDGVGEQLRLESIPSAVEQARRATAVITGADTGAHEVPWFWSDQFELKLKMAGITTPTARIIARSGGRGDGFALFHLRADDTVCAVETANAPKEFMAGKKMIAERRPIDAMRLADCRTPLRDVLAELVVPAGSNTWFG